MRRNASMHMHSSFGHEYPEEQARLLTVLDRVRLPKPMRVFAWLLIAALLIGGAVLIWVPWVQTTTGSGQVTTLKPGDRVQEISAMVSGRIAEWYVQDASYVRAGDPIVRIQDVDADLLPRLESQLAAAERKLDAARLAVETAGIDYARQDSLYRQGLASRLEYEQASIKVQELRGKQAEAAAEVDIARTSLSRYGSQVVTAPRDGTIVHVEAGDIATLVSTGTTLATFMPADVERAVEVFIDGRDIGLVQPGREVRIEFEGWPAFQFSGAPNLAVGTFAGEVVFVEPRALPDGRFRVLVKEALREGSCSLTRPDLPFAMDGNCGWPPESFTPLGAKAHTWILLETVPLGFELWRILNNFPPVNNQLVTSQ